MEMRPLHPRVLGRSFRRRSGRASIRWLSALSAPWLLASGAGAQSLELRSQERAVYARSRVVQNGLVAEESATRTAPNAAPIRTLRIAAAELEPLQLTASAQHGSRLADTLLSGGGHATTRGALSAADLGTIGEADSFFEVEFTSSETVPFALVGRVAARADADGLDSYAHVALVDQASGAVIASDSAAPGDARLVEHFGELEAGALYRLTAFALSRGEARDLSPARMGSATYQAVLAVPEASHALQLASGLALVAWLRSLRARPRVRR